MEAPQDRGVLVQEGGPNKLRAIIGKTEARRTLRTKDPREAARKFHQVAAKVAAEWDVLRQGPTADELARTFVAQLHDPAGLAAYLPLDRAVWGRTRPTRRRRTGRSPISWRGSKPIRPEHVRRLRRLIRNLCNSDLRNFSCAVIAQGRGGPKQLPSRQDSGPKMPPASRPAEQTAVVGMSVRRRQ